ncbi:MAG: ACT domain-containing protein [Verrucomicrobia bacterium]|nr:ACT domain-containing protein [Verrucomicrobiota bacterium]
MSDAGESDGGVSITTVTQLAIFMENRPGSLAHACAAIAEAGINIEALATEGNVFGGQSSEMLVRMVVSDPAKAAAVLAEEGAVAVKTDVLLIEGNNRPGLLAAIASKLATAEVNIESIYLSGGADGEKYVVILRPSDVEKAQRLLRDL